MPTGDPAGKNPVSRIWDIVEKARVGMLTTQFRGGLRARPLQARPDHGRVVGRAFERDGDRFRIRQDAMSN